MKTIFLISLLLPFKLITVSAQTTLPIIEDNCYSGVIIPSGLPFPFFKEEGRFSPDSATIAQAETELRKSFSLVRKAGSACAINNYKDLIAYKRQYFGYTKKGKKILFISFIKAHNDKWQQGIIIAEGGGCNYMQVKYELTSNRVYDFHINITE